MKSTFWWCWTRFFLFHRLKSTFLSFLEIIRVEKSWISFPTKKLLEKPSVRSVSNSTTTERTPIQFYEIRLSFGTIYWTRLETRKMALKRVYSDFYSWRTCMVIFKAFRLINLLTHSLERDKVQSQQTKKFPQRHNSKITFWASSSLSATNAKDDFFWENWILRTVFWPSWDSMAFFNAASEVLHQIICHINKIKRENRENEENRKASLFRNRSD